MLLRQAEMAEATTTENRQGHAALRWLQSAPKVRESKRNRQNERKGRKRKKKKTERALSKVGIVKLRRQLVLLNSLETQEEVGEGG